MKLAIIGSRNFKDEKLAEYYFETFFYNIWGQKLEIVSGDCSTGGDKIGKDLSIKYKLKYTGFPADWSLGRGAGFIRNKEIIDNSDFVLCFWDGESKGTKHSLTLAKEKKIPTFIVYF